MPQATLPTDRRSLSRRLHTVLYSPGVFALITPYKCGWLDGGCGIAAEGIALWLGARAQIWVLLDEQDRAQHLLARYGPWCLDGDGVSTSAALLARWARLEGIPHGRLERARAANRLMAPADPLIARRLAALLQARLPAAAVRAILAE